MPANEQSHGVRRVATAISHLIDATVMLRRWADKDRVETAKLGKKEVTVTLVKSAGPVPPPHPRPPPLFLSSPLLSPPPPTYLFSLRTFLSLLSWPML